jgi:hypothetical protein
MSQNAINSLLQIKSKRLLRLKLSSMNFTREDISKAFQIAIQTPEQIAQIPIYLEYNAQLKAVFLRKRLLRKVLHEHPDSFRLLLSIARLDKLGFTRSKSLQLLSDTRVCLAVYRWPKHLPFTQESVLKILQKLQISSV